MTQGSGGRRRKEGAPSGGGERPGRQQRPSPADAAPRNSVSLEEFFGRAVDNKLNRDADAFANKALAMIHQHRGYRLIVQDEAEPAVCVALQGSEGATSVAFLPLSFALHVLEGIADMEKAHGHPDGGRPWRKQFPAEWAQVKGERQNRPQNS